MWIYFVIAGIVILDQVSKICAASYLPDSTAITVIPQVLSFHYHENKGAAWGMLADHRWVFMVISSIAIIAILAYLIYTHREKQQVLFRLSLAFFCGGGIGNMIDRIYLGYVIDFLEFDFIEFPIFNVADSFITIGACLMIIELIMQTVSESKKKKNISSKDAPDGTV